jgi:FixJ family two-component response regulator
VYVVNPDPGMRDELLAVLGELNCDVRSYPSGEEFLSNLRSGDLGCLVMDLHLPGLSGFDLLQQLEKRRPRLPAIVLTGQGSVRSAVRAMQSGADAFIERPYVRRVLLNTIRRLIG